MRGARFGETNQESDPKDNLALLKNLIGIFLVVVLLVSAFWLSFLVGQRMLIPVTKTVVAEGTVEMPTSEALLISVTEEAIQTEVLLPKEEEVRTVKPVKREEPKPETPNLVYKVQTGFFRQFDNAKALSQKLQDKGFSNTIEELSTGFYRVQVGEFDSRKDAQNVLDQVQKNGFEAIIVYRD
ncbi:MAG: SPOR domain-containing protein [Candidatus Saganbacteria bacterium]|nr:SPOR domain-containing protein [Candidatus Saganbacteria bacterium]